MFNKLFQSYNEFHVDEIQTNRFQPEKFAEVLDQWATGEEILTLGHSIEGRPIRQVKLGKGPIRVLLWSQMHGNESTATRAILDLLKFNRDPGEFREEWRQVLDKLTLYIIPMLNPDGTAAFKRRNAAEVDLNRDARAFECSESRILRDAMRSVSPVFSFNLHDQRRFYNITGSAKPSSISFLAPAFNKEETVNDSRLAAMQLIAALRQDLETVIPGQVGLYDDSFAPRAFGDYSQSTGSSTVLIESGWEQYDIEKESIRKLNFAMMVSAFAKIASGSLANFTEQDYRQIPMNDEKLFDVLIRGARMVVNDQQVSIDVGIQRTEITIPGSEEFYSAGQVEDLGDLKEWYGFEEVEASDLMLVNGRVTDLSLAEWQELEEIDQVELIREGNLFLVHESGEVNLSSNEMINIIIGTDANLSLAFEQPANFLLINKAGEIKYVVLNGFLWPIDEAPPEGLNGLIIN